MIPVSLANNQQLSGFSATSAKSVDPKSFNNLEETLTDEKLYQILIVEECKNDYSLGLTTTVHTGTKVQLKEQFGEISRDINNFPNKGVDMENIMPFSSIKNNDDEHESQLFINQYSAVRRLLQVRKISQLIAKTWLEEDTPNIDIIRKLFIRGNRPPDQPKIHQFNHYDKINQMVIMPDQASWQTICLNLLLCGQAYWRENDNNYIRLHEPIMSTYEASCLYVLEIVWNNFAGVMEETQQTGIDSPRPPYYRVLMPYPPRPHVKDETSASDNQVSEPILTKQMIEKWATANDTGEGLSFCEKKWNEKDGINIKYVVSPYPYMVASSCC